MATQNGGPGGSDLAAQGEAEFRKAEKVNAELFSLMYGALVAQLLEDFGRRPEEVFAPDVCVVGSDDY